MRKFHEFRLSRIQAQPVLASGTWQLLRSSQVHRPLRQWNLTGARRPDKVSCQHFSEAREQREHLRLSTQFAGGSSGSARWQEGVAWGECVLTILFPAPLRCPLTRGWGQCIWKYRHTLARGSRGSPWVLAVKWGVDSATCLEELQRSSRSPTNLGGCEALRSRKQS